MSEIETISLPDTYFNRLHCWCTFNLTYSVVLEWSIVNVQPHQLRTVLQAEDTIEPHKTVLSNLHTLQRIQSNYVHSRHITKRVVSNLQRSQSRESRQIQYSVVPVTHTIVNDDLSHRIVQRHQFINTPNSRIWILPQIGMVSQIANVYWLVQAYKPFLNTERPNRSRRHHSWYSRYWDWACLVLTS